MKVAMVPRHPGKNDNPYLSLLTGSLGKMGVRFGAVFPDALHVHWLESPIWGRFSSRLPLLAELRVHWVVGLSKWLRKHNRPVVWTVHNIDPHDFFSARHKAVYSKMRRRFLPQVTDVICMDEAAVDLVKQAFPEVHAARFNIISHMNYVDHFARIKAEVPRELELRTDAPVVATFGQLRPYKGIPKIIRNLRETSLRFQFVIAGRGPDSEMAAIRGAIDGDPRFTLISRRLLDAEILGISRHSALILFNFQKVLNSGSVLASLSMGRPVLAPRFGVTASLRENLGAEWVHLFDQDLNSADLVQALENLPQTDYPDLSSYDPDLIGERHHAIYGWRP